jgi:hypothetical protein
VDIEEHLEHQVDNLKTSLDFLRGVQVENDRRNTLHSEKL